jgi:hypothetical protein
MNPVLRFVIFVKLIVFVTVCLSVYLLIRIMPSASNTMAIYINYLSDNFLLTYATPIIFERLIAPMQKPVITANTNEQ